MNLQRAFLRVLRHPGHSFGLPVRWIRSRLRAGAFAGAQPELDSVIKGVRSRHLTYLSVAGLRDLAEAVIEIERKELPGSIVEAGTALGGSAIVLARSKAPARKMWVYDTFGMIPPPSDRDSSDVHKRYLTIAQGKSKGIAGHSYYGYRPNLLEEVIQSFQEFGIVAEANRVTFTKGRFETTMNIDGPVAFAHLDCDWYESVKTCLERIEPHLVAGGRFVIDDYYSWPGCTKAVDEFFASRQAEYQFVHLNRLHIIRRVGGPIANR